MTARTWFFALSFVACSRGRPEPATIAADPVDAAPSPTPTVAPPAPAPSSEPLESVLCNADDDCGYDDPCNASACVGKGPPPDCDKSKPPPGRCVCASGRCTMLRDELATAAAKTGCKADAECGFDPPTGKCRAGEPTRNIRDRGAFCACRAGVCEAEIVEPVSCKTSHDCSWLESPWRPMPASKVPRPHPPIAPCKGGERDSVCVKGTCMLQAWKC